MRYRKNRKFAASLETMESRESMSALGAHAIDLNAGAVLGATLAGATTAPPKPLFPSYPAYQTETFPWLNKGSALGNNAIQK